MPRSGAVDHALISGPSGSFAGHLLPGLAFATWGLWWLWEIAGSRRPRESGEPLERSLLPPVAKILAVMVALPLEMPNAGWLAMDWVMGWHHITGYLGFGLSGLVDLAARRRLLSSRATHIALAAACFNAAILFYGHQSVAGVESVAHEVLLMLFVGVGVFSLLEIAAPSWRFEWFRIGSMIALGAWEVITGWILFRSGWDLQDHVREAHVWLRLSWMIIAVAIITTLVSMGAGRDAGGRSDAARN